MPIMVNMVMAAMVLLLVTNNAGRGRAGESGDDDESGRDYVPMVMMVTYEVGCSRLGAAWYLDSHKC